MMTRFLWTTAAWMILCGPAFGADIALIIGNAEYAAQRDLRGGADVVAAAPVFEGLGFDVVGRTDASRVELVDAIEQFVAGATEADRILVVLAGRFLNSSQDSWLLGVDSPASPGLSRLPSEALALSTVLAVMKQHPGRALLLVADDDDAGVSAGPYLERGLGRLSIPQGVTVFKGGTRAIASFAKDAIALPALSLTVQAARRQGLQAEGYLPEDYRFLEGVRTTPAKPEVPDSNEQAAWDEAQRADVIAGYQDYLMRFPDGAHAADANRLMAEIRNDPNRQARLAEDALGLTRDQRREIQRDLSILDINPRGIDGLFGPASRGAISTWQSQNGFDATGFLTREQINRLDTQAQRRATELETEAELRRIEQERLDRAYWKDTGAAGDEVGLRAYVKRFPDGVFAEEAQIKLDALEDDKRAAAAAQDRQAWDAAATAGSEEGYRAYLAAFPNGAFSDEAQARIDALTAEKSNADTNAAARRVEEQLGLNIQTQKLIENRLDAVGLRPGAVDGAFDDDTRRAIRRYQQARDLPVTGFLNQETVVRLLADSLFK
ncbi:peptidoglycan-binding protein [Pseudogemmobacter sp. W21_MBD1_M6]|uniref:peptidoglycan-binding protein n=1 Tax=Pseudogemmobacter sp. W21_MBD1_M6 TaxID=3240271 RepID=UPI003F958EFB